MWRFRLVHRAALCLVGVLALVGVSEGQNVATSFVEPGAGYPVRYTVRHDIGQGIGYQDSFTRLGIFLPIWENNGTALLFTDVQPLLDNLGNFGSNVGLGFRYFDPLSERVFGVYGYFDYRNTDEHSFRQGTIGVDTLGTWLDVRGNIYLPDHEPRPLEPQFVGNRLIIGFQKAMTGCDAEVGLVLPEVLNMQSRLMGGIYHFDTDAAEDADGWRVRIESHWTQRISTDIAFNHDEHFGTTFTIGIALNWQPESFAQRMPVINSFRRGPSRHVTRHASDRLAEPTCRLPNIAVRSERYVAMNGVQPWHFIHVVDGTVGGTGTFETPLGTLEDAAAIALADNVIYTPSGGTYAPPAMLQIPDDVQLWSNGPIQTVSTQDGVVVLPFSGTSTDLGSLPEIHSSVELGNGSTIDGFHLVAAANVESRAGLIKVDGKSGVTIANNEISTLMDGMRIVDATGATIVDNRIDSAVESGIEITGTNFSGTIQGNTLTNNDQTGLLAVLTGNFDGQILNNVISNNEDTTATHPNGLYLQAATITSGSRIESNTFDSNEQEGASLFVTGAGASVVDVVDNAFQSNNSDVNREFFARLGAGGGPFEVRLGGNSSANTVPLGQFNYDFSQDAPGDDLDYVITSANTGAVGSSDGSVTP